MYAFVPTAVRLAAPCRTSATVSHASKSSFVSPIPQRSSLPSRIFVNSTTSTTSPSKKSITRTPITAVQKSPAETFEAAVTLGSSKASLPSWKVTLLAILAGAYIALGALLALCVGGAAPALKAANPGLQKLLFGAFGLPGGLLLVCVAGGELFTGNTALLTCAFMQKRAGFGGVLRNWIWSYIGNVLGCALVTWLAVVSGCVGGAGGAAAAAIASAKVGMPFMTAFMKGIVCNWLVCLAVYTQNGANDLIGKFIAIWLPICAFVAMGFEHCVANMFLIPFGMAMGAEVTVKQYLMANLLPVTLGNLVAGVVFVGLAYSLAFGKKKAAA
ncbi:Nitrite transporter NAR1 [Gracilaria domingensis]|nr:Nitrite transporter NAR1 [Gracilaria domingensis]